MKLHLGLFALTLFWCGCTVDTDRLRGVKSACDGGCDAATERTAQIASGAVDVTAAQFASEARGLDAYSAIDTLTLDVERNAHDPRVDSGRSTPDTSFGADAAREGATGCIQHVIDSAYVTTRSSDQKRFSCESCTDDHDLQAAKCCRDTINCLLPHSVCDVDCLVACNPPGCVIANRCVVAVVIQVCDNFFPWVPH